jgi:hypothetical protein
MTSPNLVRGQLSLGSYIKLFVIDSIGILPIWAIFWVAVLLIKSVRGDTIIFGDNLSVPISNFWYYWPIGLLLFIPEAISIIVSSAFLGLFSYPFYAWLCRKKPGGLILKGKFDVL